ncbi:MAG: hypothetical protein ACI9Y7_000347 [Dokdonia sp.]|jgi:hypothetical protein
MQSQNYFEAYNSLLVCQKCKYDLKTRVDHVLTLCEISKKIYIHG